MLESNGHSERIWFQDRKKMAHEPLAKIFLHPLHIKQRLMKKRCEVMNKEDECHTIAWDKTSLSYAMSTQFEIKDLSLSK